MRGDNEKKDGVGGEEGKEEGKRREQKKKEEGRGRGKGKGKIEGKIDEKEEGRKGVSLKGRRNPSLLQEKGRNW